MTLLAIRGDRSGILGDNVDVIDERAGDAPHIVVARGLRSIREIYQRKKSFRL